MQISLGDSSCKCCGKPITEEQRRQFLTERTSHTEKGITAGALNLMLAQFFILAPVGVWAGLICSAGIAWLGFESKIIRSLAIAAGVLVAALLIRSSWKNKNYRLNPVIPGRTTSNAIGHALIAIGNFAILAAIPFVLFTPHHDHNAVIGGVAILISGWIATPAWIVGSILVHRTTYESDNG